MKRDNVNYVLVGLVVLAALAALLVTLALITGRTGAAVEYHAYYDNVTGLSLGAPIFYEGYRVGQVSDIEPDRSGERTRYRVELSIRRDWSIPDDSVARLVSSGLLADVSIGIREGVSATKLEPGSEIAGAGAADIFMAMNDLAAELTLLTRERLRPLVDTLSLRLDSIGSTLDDSMPALVEDTRALLASLNRSAGALEQTLGPENRQAIGETLSNVREVTAELKLTRERADALLLSLDGAVDENRPEIRRAVADLGHTVGAIAQRIEAITHHLESSSRNLDEFSREIRRNPNRLLFTPPPDEVE
ncbi:MAG TPA: MlaD family protein [Xanthomonadaceae bacterium]|nr:MlaD family protein [Xanthomonadaceae bacterium]